MYVHTPTQHTHKIRILTGRKAYKKIVIFVIVSVFVVRISVVLNIKVSCSTVGNGGMNNVGVILELIDMLALDVNDGVCVEVGVGDIVELFEGATPLSSSCAVATDCATAAREVTAPAA